MDRTYISLADIQKHRDKIRDHFAPLHRAVIDAFVYSLETVQAADVEEVLHGAWVTPVTNEPWRQGSFGKCTCCNYINAHTDKAPKFCENCGARMNGVNK